MTTHGSDMIFYHTPDQDATIIYLVSLVLAYLIYPLLGWMADVCFTRYSFVRASFLAMIVSMIMLIVAGILFLTKPDRSYFLLSGLSELLLRSASYMYLMLGILLYFSSCTLSVKPTDNPFDQLHSYEFVTILIACASVQLSSASWGVGILVGFKQHLNIDRTGDHPLKLIYQVLRYAWKHKWYAWNLCQMVMPGAFTYWEDDVPPRIDLGMNKY